LSVFVLDQRNRPVMPCCEKRARLLLECGRAVVDRRYPLTIRSKDRARGDVEPVQVKTPPAGPPALPSSPTRIATSPRRFSACSSLLTGDGRSAKLLGRAARSAVAAQTFATARFSQSRRAEERPRFFSRLRHGNRVGSRLAKRRHGASRGANRQAGRDPRWMCCGWWQRLATSGPCRQNQRQVLANFSIARTAIATPGNRASSPS
jgi:hypothetical protein